MFVGITHILFLLEFIVLLPAALSKEVPLKADNQAPVFAFSPKSQAMARLPATDLVLTQILRWSSSNRFGWVTRMVSRGGVKQ